MIEYVLDNLAPIGEIDRIYVVTNAKFADHFQKWADGYRTKMGQLEFTVINDGSTDDSNKLGAIGDLHLVLRREKVDDDIVVVAGDNLFSEKLEDFGRVCREKAAPVLAVYDVGNLEEIKKYNSISVDPQGRITYFEEKPKNPTSTLTGIAPNIYHSTASIEKSFHKATIYALILILILVFIDLKSITQTIAAVSVLALGLPFMFFAYLLIFLNPTIGLLALELLCRDEPRLEIAAGKQLHHAVLAAIGELAQGEDVDDVVVTEMKNHGIVGVSIAIIENGEIRKAKGYGFTDKSAATRVTTDTLFQAGSVSKPVAALGALRMVEDGRLSLDEDVNRKLKRWQVPENEFTKNEKVTLRRIVSHSAGLTSKNRLVTRRVRFIAGPIDIWWQRHGTTGINIDVFIERDDPLAVCGDFLDPQTHVVDHSRRAHAHFAAWRNHARPTRGLETFEKQKFDPAVVGESSCCQHARVV
jgi:hypothetical protein